MIHNCCEDCRENFLHARNLREMAAARRQLARIMSLSLASAAGHKSIAGQPSTSSAGQASSALSGKDAALRRVVEGSVAKDPGKSVMECLRRAIAAGWADQVSQLLQPSVGRFCWHTSRHDIGNE